MKSPTISAVVPAYNAERYIGESLTAILSQTHAPDEVIVIDDGSTDGTPEELARFRGDVRVMRQDNRGHAPALNRGMSEARGDYLAKCDADDIWESDKLARQVQALRAHPEIDIAFSGARFFGLIEGPRAPYPGPGSGLLDRRDFARRLYRANFVCVSSTLIRRRLYQHLGPFVERPQVAEDYEFWMRALAAGAVFFYDPSVLVRYRSHEQQLSNNMLRMHEAEYVVHGWHSGLVDNSRLVRKVLARDLSNIARTLSDQERPREARATFVSSLRHRPTLRVLAWVLVLSAPDRYRRPLADGLVSIKRALYSGAAR
jgi:glycosyltransferase involved in cell wall biosynthesis